MKKLMPLMLALLLSSCSRQSPTPSAPATRNGAAPTRQVRPVETSSSPAAATPTLTPAATPAPPAVAGEVKLDIAVEKKALASPAGWTEWILPVDVATATKDFHFSGGTGPGGADTIRVTLATGVGNWSNQYAIDKAPGHPLEGVISDHAVAQGNGEDGSCAMKLAIEGLPAGKTVKAVAIVSVNKAGYDAFYGEHGSFNGSIGVSANGANVAAEASYITEPVDAKNAGIPFSFTATGKDNLSIANTKSNWLIMPLDGIALAIAP